MGNPTISPDGSSSDLKISSVGYLWSCRRGTTSERNPSSVGLRSSVLRRIRRLSCAKYPLRRWLKKYSIVFGPHSECTRYLLSTSGELCSSNPWNLLLNNSNTPTRYIFLIVQGKSLGWLLTVVPDPGRKISTSNIYESSKGVRCSP